VEIDCKHGVAVALKLLESAPADASAQREDWRSWLQALPRDQQERSATGQRGTARTAIGVIGACSCLGGSNPCAKALRRLT